MVVQLLSHFQLFATLWTAVRQAPLGVCSDSCPLIWWCYLTISSSATPFFCLQFFPASGSFPISQLFVSGDQSIGASTSILPMNIPDWFPLLLTGWSPWSPRDSSRIFYNTIIWKHQFFGTQPSLWSNSHIHIWLLEKPQHWLCGPLLAK